MPEDRMGHITKAREELQRTKPTEDLPVSYILATEPGTTRTGTVKEVHLSAEAHAEEGSTVLIKVDIPKADLPPEVRPGTQVTGKVFCGYRAIGYVWFHDVIAFIESRVLFKL